MSRTSKTQRRGPKLGFGVFGSILMSTCASIALAQPVVFVDVKAEGANNGSSWTDAYTDLQPALDAAKASGGAISDIWIAAGTYKPSKRTIPDDPRSATFQLIDGVSVYGGFDTNEESIDERVIEENETILSGDLNGDDGPDFTNYDENAYHVVSATDNENSIIFDGLTITGGHTPGNRALVAYGGGMYLDRARPEIRNCTFTRNLAEHPEGNVAWSGGGGAALVLFHGYDYPNQSPLTVSRSRFMDNRSARWGGAVLVFPAPYSGGSVVFSECTFERNDGWGAFTGWDGMAYTFRNCTFSGNSSTTWGSAVSVIGHRELLMDGCRLERNIGPQGAAVHAHDGNVVIRNSVFVDNSAESGPGGALQIGQAETVELSDSEFRGNSADYAGAAQLDPIGSTVVRRCQFIGNSAKAGAGGGLFVSAYGLIQVTDSTFTNNSAAKGGGLYAHGPIDATGSNFANNTSWTLGGGAHVSGFGTIRFEDSKFERNRADWGGGIYFNYAPLAIMDRCQVIQNKALLGGGLAAAVWSTDLQLVNSLVADNQAEDFGGGVATGPGSLTLTNSTIAGNTAGALGAGMSVGSISTITNSIFWGNVLDPSGEARTDEVAQIDGIEFADIQHSDVQGWSGIYGGDGNIGLDPLFVDPIDPDGYYGPMEADYRLQEESPCINAGMTKNIDWGPWDPPPPNLDLDGKPRTLCGQIDMGVYEFGLPGDADCDLLLDLDDFSQWSLCMDGPDAIAPSPDCSAFDFDGDSDIDLRDLAGFQQVFTPAKP